MSGLPTSFESDHDKTCLSWGLSCKPNDYLFRSLSFSRMRLARHETCLSPPVKYFTYRSKAVLHLWIIYVISVLFLLCFCALLIIGALWSPARKRLTSLFSFVMSYCEVVTFSFVSWVSSGA